MSKGCIIVGMKVLKFNVIFEQDEDGYYVASVPSLAGCYTQGKTLEEAKKRINEVIKVCLQDDPEQAESSRSGFIGIDTVTINA